MIGCGLGSHFFEFTFYHSFEIFIAGIISLIILVSVLVGCKKWNHAATIFLSLVLLGTTLIYGSNHAVHARDPVLSNFLDETLVLEGVVISDPEISGDKQKFTLRTDFIINDSVTQKVNDKILVTLPQYPAVAYGDELRVESMLAQPEPFATEYGRTFAYDDFLRSQGIGYTMFAQNSELIDSNQTSSIISFLFDVKHNLFSSLARFMHAPYESIARAMVFGDKSGIPNDLETVFQKTGLIHIMVLSGYNITIIAVALLAVTRPFGRKFGIVISVIAIISFLLMTGLTPTSLRAGIMGGIGLLALGTFRRAHPLRALFLAGAIMAILNPFLLFESVSFQLSFLATLGLITLSPLFMFVKIPKTAGLREIIASTIATQVAVLPILLGSIGMVSVIGILMNILIVPWVPIIMAGAAGSAVLGLLLPVLGSVLGIIVEYLVRVLVWIVSVGEHVSVFSFANISAFTAFTIGCVISLLIIMCSYFLHRRRLRIPLVY